MEVIWFGTNTNLKKLQSVDLTLHVGADTVTPADAVHDLGAVLDSERPIMVKHIAKITSVCYYYLWRLKQIRRILGSECRRSARVVSRMVYCNSVLAGLPMASIMTLPVQNTATKLFKLLRLRDHILSTIRNLHWLRWSSVYKLSDDACSQQPSMSWIHRRAAHSSRLRSVSSNHYEVPRTRLKFGESFSTSVFTAWNSLQMEITDIPITECFRTQLKTYVLWHNYVIRLWSQGGDVTHFIIFGCEQHTKKCGIIIIIINNNRNHFLGQAQTRTVDYCLHHLAINFNNFNIQSLILKYYNNSTTLLLCKTINTGWF